MIFNACLVRKCMKKMGSLSHFFLFSFFFFWVFWDIRNVGTRLGTELKRGEIVRVKEEAMMSDEGTNMKVRLTRSSCKV